MQHHHSLPSFKVLNARRAEIAKKRTPFVNRFIPIPTDTFGRPFSVKTSINLINQLQAKNQQQILHYNPCFLTIGEVSKVLKTTANTILNRQKSKQFYYTASSSENEEFESVEVSTRVSPPSPQEVYQDVIINREEIERLFQSNIYKILDYSETAMINVENLHGVDSLVKMVSATSSSNNIHRVWFRNRWYVCGAGKHCRPSYNTSSMSQKEQLAADTSNLFFSDPSFVNELEKVFQRHKFKSRLWVPPTALPRTIAVKNGESSRIIVPYELPKSLIPGYCLESKLDKPEERYRIGRPFHFWARTGLRVQFREEEFDKLGTALTQSSMFGFYAWFSSLDLKLFGYRLRDGEKSLMQFTEERLITVVPLCKPYVSEDTLAFFFNNDDVNSQKQTPIPPPPASSSNQQQKLLRILRNDFKWSVVPISRLELPENEEDAERVKNIPVADAQVLSSLGLKTELPPLVLTMKIPVSAYNVYQLEPEENEVNLPAPWMLAK